jgi:hypothetical protein
LSKGDVIAQGLKEKYRTRLGAAARQILAADKGSTSEGVLVVQIEPDTGSYSLTREQLDAGTIVGRFKKYSAGSLRRFGLGAKDNESYWYVFRSGADYLGRFVSESMDTTYIIQVEEHMKAEAGLEEIIPWKQAIAQFEYLGPLGGDLRKGHGDAEPAALAIMEGGGSSVWISCMALGCCKVQ